MKQTSLPQTVHVLFAPLRMRLRGTVRAGNAPRRTAQEAPRQTGHVSFDVLFAPKHLNPPLARHCVFPDPAIQPCPGFRAVGVEGPPKGSPPPHPRQPFGPMVDWVCLALWRRLHALRSSPRFRRLVMVRAARHANR